MTEHILIIDYGSQYTRLIARCLRELNVYSIIRHPPVEIDWEDSSLKGVIFSGGPASAHLKEAPQLPLGWQLGKKPILGICYGMQAMNVSAGGELATGEGGEYGSSQVNFQKDCPLFKDFADSNSVWMSHGDQVAYIADDFFPVAATATCPVAAMQHKNLPLFGIQFHPEVSHTVNGKQIIRNFLDICQCQFNWNLKEVLEHQIQHIRDQVGNGEVIGAVSGGVDSTVMAALLHQAIGHRFHAVFVDNGLLRLNEREEVENLIGKDLNIDLEVIDAKKAFLSSLYSVTEPEQKRKIIGKLFIDVFTQAARKHKEVKFLAQGTLYPDVIESAGESGPATTIKTHHNVGGLPKDLNFELVEPFRFLFKDEVREIGKLLKIPPNVLNRHPFPGPGLAVRILGEVNSAQLNCLRKADWIVRKEIEKDQELQNQLWQVFAVLLPVRSVGVMGDQRTYDQVIALRAVESRDGMTADWARLPYALLGRISSRIINEVKGVNRVVYDISSKPPATIEWE